MFKVVKVHVDKLEATLNELAEGGFEILHLLVIDSVADTFAVVAQGGTEPVLEEEQE